MPGRDRSGGSRELTDEQWHALQLAYDVLCDPMLDDSDARTGAQHHVGNVIVAVNRSVKALRRAMADG